MEISEKVAYLRGLCEGMKLDMAKDEHKLIVKLMDIEDVQDEIAAQLDEVDEDLSYVEDFVYGEEDDCCCDTFECPVCGEEICLDESVLDGDDNFVVCPACGEKIEFDCDCDCGCDCDCDCDCD